MMAFKGVRWGGLMPAFLFMMLDLEGKFCCRYSLFRSY